jgi:hypothetical protein
MGRHLNLSRISATTLHLRVRSSHPPVVGSLALLVPSHWIMALMLFTQAQEERRSPLPTAGSRKRQMYEKLRSPENTWISILGSLADGWPLDHAAATDPQPAQRPVAAPWF